MTLVEITHKCGHCLGSFSPESRCFTMLCPKCKKTFAITQDILNAKDESEDFNVVRFEQDDSLERKIYAEIFEYLDHEDWHDLEGYLVPRIRAIVNATEIPEGKCEGK